MKEEKPFQERRSYMRLKASVSVEYNVIGKPGTMGVFSKDISAGGLCVIIKEQLPKDTPLQLEIKIPDLKDPICALARVIWQKRFEIVDKESKVGYDTGVEFTGISDFDRFNINRYVMERVEPAS